MIKVQLIHFNKLIIKLLTNIVMSFTVIKLTELIKKLLMKIVKSYTVIKLIEQINHKE